MHRRIVLAALTLAACGDSSSTSTTTVLPFDSGTEGGATCDPYGTFAIKGTLNGTETICGLSLGSFDGATLVIAKGSSDTSATVTVTNSGQGHIDVKDCKATVKSCAVSASCKGSTDQGATVSLSLNVNPTSITGSSSLGFNGCQAPGLSFSGTR
jgi:hypothetical protein